MAPRPDLRVCAGIAAAAVLDDLQRYNKKRIIFDFNNHPLRKYADDFTKSAGASSTDIQTAPYEAIAGASKDLAEMFRSGWC